MTVGERIKKIRLERGLSQKQLALMAGMSEPAIRNYELGNRKASEKQLTKIAGALNISIYALDEPCLDTYNGVLHVLFRLEEEYGLTLLDNENDLHFRIYPNAHIYSEVQAWADEKQKFENGEISKEEYEIWKLSYPRRNAEQDMKRIREFQEKKKGESL